MTFASSSKCQSANENRWSNWANDKHWKGSNFYSYRPLVKHEPLPAPKEDKATEMGIMMAANPRIRLPQVCISKAFEMLMKANFVKRWPNLQQRRHRKKWSLQLSSRSAKMSMNYVLRITIASIWTYHIRYINHNIANNDHWNTKNDCQWQIAMRPDQLFGNVIQIIPAIIGPKSGIKCWSNVR